MTTSAEELPLVTFEDFLAGEQLSERRHELVGGRVYVMAGGSERHDLMAGLVYEAVAPGARARTAALSQATVWCAWVPPPTTRT